MSFAARASPVTVWLESARGAGAFPRASAAWGTAEGVIGRCDEPPTAAEPHAGAAAVYDLASLTKVVSTTMIALRLLDRGALSLSDTIGRFFAAPEEKAGITLLDLLRHTGGFAAHIRLDRAMLRRGAVEPAAAPRRDGTGGIDIRERQRQAVAALLEAPLGHRPGTKVVYSCLGFIVLGAVLEKVGGASLDRLARELVFDPLEMHDTGYKPLEWTDRERIVPTEWDDERGASVHGEVHDENARFLGGISANAGLFSTATDLAGFAAMLVRGGEGFLEPPTFDSATRDWTPGMATGRGLGFQLYRPSSDSVIGDALGEGTYGHTGFTGTSLFVSPRHGAFAILLTNRVHYGRDLSVMPDYRARFHEAVVLELQTGAAGRGSVAPWAAAYRTGASPTSRQVVLGIERRDELDRLLAGRRIGLLTTAGATDREGRQAVDILAESFDVRLLFGPEHGVRGTAQAGEHISSGVDPVTGIPVRSLYGADFSPTSDDLSALDVLVVDLPDVGSRYYTYLATLSYAMERAAETGTPMVILDRPNPVSGSIVEGSVLADGVRSFVGLHPVPVRHGLTVGEYTRYLESRLVATPPLEVIRMLDWRRDWYWQDLGRPWIPPSPNLATAEAALLYVGTCLFEGTNVSEGRGTTRPFTQIGAPWLDPADVLRIVDPALLPGLRLETTGFRPDSSKFDGVDCRGVRLEVIDRSICRPYSTGVALLDAIRRTHSEFAFRPPAVDGERFFIDLLSGDDEIRSSSFDCPAYLDRCRRQAEAFRRYRSRFLLYG